MKHIEIEDKTIFDKYKNPSILNSEYQFTTLFAWANKYNFSYQEYEDTLFIFGNQNDGSLQCYYPIGNNSLDRSIEYIEKFFKNKNTPLNLRPLSKEMLECLKPYIKDNYLIGTKISYADYICDFQELINYSGSKYKHKRKFANAFYKKYEFEYKSLTTENIEYAAKGLFKIISNSMPKGNFDHDEWQAYSRLLNNFDKLNLKGGIIVVDNEVVAVSVAERVFENIIIHIRRCNKSFIGVYPAMLQLLLKNEFCDNNYKFVNLQDDMGIENLRKSKLSYKPVILLEKYYIKEESSCEINNH